MKTSIVVIVVVIIVALGGWYYWANYTHQPAPAGQTGVNGLPNQGTYTGSSTSTFVPQGDGTTVKDNLILGLNTSGTLGNYLGAYNGMTVYTYSPDMSTMGKSSACTGTCAAKWPPYTVSAASDIHVSAATTGAVSTITRADGTLQVTYNGMPLYFYSGDKAIGDTLGQGIGGVWYVVKP